MRVDNASGGDTTDSVHIQAVDARRRREAYDWSAITSRVVLWNTDAQAQCGRASHSTLDALRLTTTTMNSFATRFSTTGAEAEIRKAKEITGEDDDMSDAMWGSEAGLGGMVNGGLTFAMPAVHDVS